MTQEWDDLIDRQLAGTLSEEEAVELQVALMADHSLRLRFLDFANLDAALEAKATSADATRALLVAPYDSNTPISLSWISSRLVTASAAAIGMVIGLFSASVVFAFVIPRVKAGAVLSVPVLTESFEEKESDWQRGFPTRSGIWSGDLIGSSTADAGFQPKDGERMVRLAPHDTRKFSYAWRIIDLNDYPIPEGTESRQVEVTASFHGGLYRMRSRYQIRIAAFAEEPSNVKAIWNGDNMSDQVLQHVGRTVTASSDDSDWQFVRATMEIPPGARSLVVSLASAVADDTAPKNDHYLDDIHVQFINKELVP